MNIPRIVLLLLVIGFTAAISPPARADAAKPPWMHEGLCLTYTWHGAVAPGNGSDYQEDEHGDWVNAATGRRYTRTTQQGTSGSGWTQATIATIEGDRVVVSTQNFGDAGALGKNVPVPLQGGASFVTPIDEAGDYWVSPEKLAALHTDGATGMLVTPTPWKAAEKTVNAIRVQITSGGGYSLHVFDARTGLCLHYATAVRGAAPKLAGPGDMGKGDLTLTHGDLVAARDPAIPWGNQPTPAWVQNLKALHYRGSTVSRGALPTVPNEVSIDLVMLNHAQNWVEMASTGTVQMRGVPQIPPTQGQVAFGRAQFGGLWISPAALASLKIGQVLDEDPLTRIKTAVTKANDTSIVIAQQNAAGEIDSQYEKATGLLTATSFVNVLSQQQMTVRLQGRE